MTSDRKLEDRRVVDALNAEWEQLSCGPSSELPPWTREPVFVTCGGLAAVLEVVRAQPDPALRTLVGAAQSGDLLAARVVLQALLPKMVLMARRDRWVGVSDYLGQLWCVVQTFPIERRDRGLAGNLVLDTLKQVVRERHHGPPSLELAVITEPHVAPGRPVGRYEAERVLASAHELELIDPATRSILRTVYLDGLTSREAAERHGGTPEMVRYRCSRAVRRLAGHAVELAAA